MKTSITLGLFAALTVTHLPAGDWPQWRGPRCDGHFTGAVWPDKLDTTRLRQTWRAKLEPSYSGPVVSGGRVITTQTKATRLEEVTAFDLRSDNQLIVREPNASVAYSWNAPAALTPGFEGGQP